jgi:hypothetical protein
MAENTQNQEDLVVQSYYLDPKGILVVNDNYRFGKNNPKTQADGSVKMYWKCTDKACTGRANSIQTDNPVPNGPATIANLCALGILQTRRQWTAALAQESDVSSPCEGRRCTCAIR